MIVVFCSPAPTPTSTIFDPRTVIDRATFEMPNQHPEGIKFVIVNGQLSVDDGRRTRSPVGKSPAWSGYAH